MSAPFPGLYCDPYFTTSILPVIAGSPQGTAAGTALAASYNGIVLEGLNPVNALDAIKIINLNISKNCYRNKVIEPYPYDCLQNTYDGITYANIPARYVIMGEGNVADQLIVTAPGVYQYIQTDIRYPPAYLPAP